MIDAQIVYDRAFNEGLKPDPLLTISEWADQYRVLSKTASSEPGRYRTNRTPPLKEIMDCLSPYSPVEEVVFKKGAQVGATECGNNWIGYIIDQSPGPALVVLPTVELGKRWSKGRLTPLINDTPCLKDRIKDPRSRDSGNTIQTKEFADGTGILQITGANSSVGLRSMPVRYLFLDEVDAYPLDVDGEGDPTSLAVRRTSNFTRRKIFKVSTPTIEGLSRIDRDFKNSDQRYYHVPCPHCHEKQVLKWEQLRYDNDDPTTTRYICEHCDGEIYNHQKTWMLENGEWIAERPEITKIAGFHLSSLYSPVGWFSWEDAVEQFIKADDDERLLKVWYNTVLGETWAEKGDAPEWERLHDRSEDYKIGFVPEGGLFLTAGLDVQRDRVEVEVVAWGLHKQSWSVDYRVFYGDVSDKAFRERVYSEIMDRHYEHACGASLSVQMLAIDSGYATQDVYNWVRTKPMSRCMAVKGQERSSVPLGTPSKVDVTIRGKKLRHGARVWPVGVSLLKSELYHWLKLGRNEDETYPNGYCHFPKYDTEFFKQLCAEQLITKIVKGYPKHEWQKTRDRNEALDCRIYARAAAIALGADRWSDRKWQKLAENFAVSDSASSDEAEATPPPENPKPTKSVTRKTRRRKSTSSMMR